MKLIFWNEMRHHCLRYGHGLNATSFIHVNSVPDVLELPFSNDETLSGCEEIVSSGTDPFTAWVKMSEHEMLVQHMVDIHKATAEFREASERKPATSSHKNSCTGDSAPTTGTLDPDEEKTMLLRNKLQDSGISLPCRRRPTTLTTSFSRIAST